MDIKQLKYFIAIAEEGSISKAAKRLHMAQPPLSQQLKAMESELGVELFERSTRKLEITSSGQAMYHKAKQILKLMDIAIKEVKDISDGLAGKLSIGTVSAAGATFLPQLISNFHSKFPNISFEIIDEDTPRIIELLSKGFIDIGIIRTPYNTEGFKVINLPEEPMIVASKTDYWDKNRKVITIKELNQLPLVLHRRYEKTIGELCNKKGFSPNIICKSNDVRTILLWANAGIGVAIIPKNCLDLIPNTKLYHRELKEAELKVGTAIIWPKNGYQSSPTKRFISLLQD
ncbi:MAG TPA: LysR family transcriptional regulator [Clostridium sp.]|jgi:DNA-binding transcriptional LysR family regulator|nr:LysR family transcriptional regulator [Clostridia bacterium]HCW03471.1 LysR family transcriptional regulator [Clostridium sp.]